MTDREQADNQLAMDRALCDALEALLGSWLQVVAGAVAWAETVEDAAGWC